MNTIEKLFIVGLITVTFVVLLNIFGAMFHDKYDMYEACLRYELRFGEKHMYAHFFE